MKKILLLMLSLVMVTTTMAEGVTPDEALNQARNFVKKRENNGMRPHRAPGTAASRLVMAKQVHGLYVFNVAKNEGFVIVSNDDRTEPILGYSDNGHFDPENMPENMKAWLKGYADQIAWLNKHPEVQNTIQKAPTKNPVAPLIPSQWNQDEPYNLQCPIDPTTNKLCMTGCVATAMAQVMYYYKWPATTSATIPAYTTQTRGINVAAIPSGTSFDWDNMLESYNNKEDDVYKNAVAKLMKTCGAAVQMNYRSSSSGANVGASHLITYFDYSKTARKIFRDSYSFNDWNNLIYTEIAENRPVLYAGGEHQYIVDGYDDEYFHVNWGWGGYQDGYFLLSALRTNKGGIGSSAGNDYGFNQEAIIGIQPNHGEEGYEEGACLTFYNLSISGSTITFGRVQNNESEQYSFNYGIGIVDENGNITEKSIKNTTLGPSYYLINSQSFTVSSSWGNGTYKVVPISRVSGTSEWIPGMNPNLQYFEVVINGSNITITFIGAPELSVTSFNYPGNKKTNAEQPVDIIVHNNGGEYYGPLYLFASTTNTKDSYKSKASSTILSRNNYPVSFSFTPSVAGTYNIWICTDESGNNVIGQSSVVIEAASTETYSLSAQGLAIENGNPSSTYGGNIYGTRIKGTFSLKNTGTTTFNDNVTIQLYKYMTYNGTLSYWSSDKQIIATTIAAGETKVIDFDFNNQDKTEYLVRCTYGNTYTQYPRYNSYTLVDGIEIFMADGISSATGAQTSVTVPANAAAVNLSGVSGVTNVTGGNENTLFIFGADDNVPSSLNRRNVVKGGNAENITLQDGYDFYSPVTFTADNITYTRTFDTGLTRNYENWTTIVLPFDVNKVTVDLTSAGYSQYAAYPIDWFHNAEEKMKNFWVMEFGSEENGIVNFSHAAEIKAARPLLIAVPGAEWGSKNDLTNLPITFHGQNATVSGDFRASTSGDNYKMKGVVCQKVFNDIFVLNADGTAFTRQNSATVDAFRAYFEPTSTAATAQMLTMAFGDGNQGETTALKPVFDHETTNQGNTIYDLQGRKLNGKPTQKGIYIVNGKKVIRK